MKVVRVEKGIVTDSVVWKNRVAGIITFSEEMNINDEIGVPFILDKLIDFMPKPRWILLTGDDPLRQNQTDFFNMLQVFKAWYPTKGLKRVLIKTKSSISFPEGVDDSFRSFLSFEVFIDMATQNIIKTNFEKIPLKENDSVVFSCPGFPEMHDVFYVLKSFVNNACFKPVVYIQLKNDKDFAKCSAELLSWAGLSEYFDIRLVV